MSLGEKKPTSEYFANHSVILSDSEISDMQNTNQFESFLKSLKKRQENYTMRIGNK